MEAIDAVVPQAWPEAAASFGEDTTLGYKYYSIKNAADNFETVLSAELQGMDTTSFHRKALTRPRILSTEQR